ncbi:unnamed protein product [Diamesa serratosioi]
MATVEKKAKVENNEEREEKLLEEIDSCQNEIDALNEKASEEILKIEQRYNKLRSPFYEKRNEIINKVPNFWVTSFINHPRISSVLDEQEESVLHFMTTLHVEDFDDIKTGYKISFSFKENPYFSNDVLTKEFHLAVDSNSSNPNHTSTSTPILWKEGKDLLKQLQNKQTSNSRKRDLEYKSFFDWFSDNSDPLNDDLAETIKDDIWPNPLQYFLVPEIDVYKSDQSDDDENEDEEDGEGEEEIGEDEDQ